MVKVTLEHATKAQRKNRGIALFFLYPRRYMVVGGQRNAPAALLPGKTRYPLVSYQLNAQISLRIKKFGH